MNALFFLLRKSFLVLCNKKTCMLQRQNKRSGKPHFMMPRTMNVVMQLLIFVEIRLEGDSNWSTPPQHTDPSVPLVIDTWTARNLGPRASYTINVHRGVHVGIFPGPGLGHC